MHNAFKNICYIYTSERNFSKINSRLIYENIMTDVRSCARFSVIETHRLVLVAHVFFHIVHIFDVRYTQKRYGLQVSTT